MGRAARTAADRSHRVVVVLASGADLLAESAEALGMLRTQGHTVHVALMASRFPGVGPVGDAGAPHHLTPGHTRSWWRRPILAVARAVTLPRHRAVLAARFDPWFRQVVRGADDVVALDAPASAATGVARELGAQPRVHHGEDGLTDLVLEAALDWLTHAGAALAPRLPVTRLTDEQQAEFHAVLDSLTPLAQPLAADPPWQLRTLPGLTRDPTQSRDLADRVSALVGEGDPVPAAYRALADLTERGSTTAQPNLVGATVLEAAEPLVTTEPDGVTTLASLALDVAFHRELHSDTVEAPLVRDPEAYLAPLRATRVWGLLTGPVAALPGPPAAAHATDLHRGVDRAVVRVLPGPYGTFYEALAGALAQDPELDVRVLPREELPPRLRTMGTSRTVIGRRLAAGLGEPDPSGPVPASAVTAAVTHPVPQVVVVDWADKAALEATLATPPGSRLVLRVHGVDALRPWIHLLDWSRVDALICVSAPLLALVHDIVGEPARAVPSHVVPNPVDLGGFADAADDGPTREPHTLCLVGWAQRVKDPLWALEVLAALRGDGSDWRLLLVGADFVSSPTASGAAYATAFRERAMADDVRDHLEFTGFVTDLAPVLARAGFVLSSSLRESWPVGPAEAVSAGAVPVFRDWPMVSSRGGAGAIYPADWVVDSVSGAVERIRSLADPADRAGAARTARDQLGRLTAPDDTARALREIVRPG